MQSLTEILLSDWLKGAKVFFTPSKTKSAATTNVIRRLLNKRWNSSKKHGDSTSKKKAL
jgi:hypothetical protein